MSKEMAKAHEAEKANRKTKKAKKTKPAQTSAAAIEIEDESWLDCHLTTWIMAVFFFF